MENLLRPADSGAEKFENEELDFSDIVDPAKLAGAEDLLGEFEGEEGLLGKFGLSATPSSVSPSIQSITGLKELPKPKKKRPSRKEQREKLLNSLPKEPLSEEPCINLSDTTRPKRRDVKRKLTSGAYSLEGPIVPVVPVVQVELEALEAPVAPEPTEALEVPTGIAEKKDARGGTLEQATKQRKKHRVSFSDELTVVRFRPEQTIFNITDPCSHYNPYYIIQEKYGVFGKFPEHCTCFILNTIDFNCPIHNEQGLLISYLRSLYNGEIYPIFEGKPQLAASATDQMLKAERVVLEFYFGCKIQNETLFWQRIREIFGDSNLKLSYVFFTGEGNNVEIIQELKEITPVMIDELCGFMMIDQWCIFLHPKPRIHFHIMY